VDKNCPTASTNTVVELSRDFTAIYLLFFFHFFLQEDLVFSELAVNAAAFKLKCKTPAHVT